MVVYNAVSQQSLLLKMHRRQSYLLTQNSNLLPPFVDPPFGAVDEVDSMFTPMSEIPTDFDRRKGGGVITFD